MYKTLVYFEDLTDKSRPYNAGDTFPREGLQVTEERYKELSTAANRRGIPLIELVPDEKPETEELKTEEPKIEESKAEEPETEKAETGTPKRRKRKE